jgi:hypothetical protein
MAFDSAGLGVVSASKKGNAPSIYTYQTADAIADVAPALARSLRFCRTLVALLTLLTVRRLPPLTATNGIGAGFGPPPF